jgi:LmbE family N-acetylglucosaminyl deacetylase
MLVDPPAPGSVLVVMAHPDDAEFSAGGTLARWIDGGTRVVLCICTNGDKGTHDPEAGTAVVAELREREARAAARVLGAVDVTFLGHPDGTLQNTLELRREIVRVIRTVRPEAVLTSDPTRVFGPTFINHPDHRAAGGATLDAVFPSARDRLAYPDLLAQGFDAHRVAEVYVANPLLPDTAVDVSAHVERKLDALREHRSQVTEERLSAFVPQRLRDAGAQAGVAMAELFCRVTLP